MKERTDFTSDLLQTVSSTVDGDVGKAPSDLAEELGIRRNQLYKWKPSWRSTDEGVD